jgi:hypothetical protein
MRYYKLIRDGYIISIGVGECGVEISKEEYDSIKSVFETYPYKDGYYYKLKLDLTWEEHESEVVEIEPTETEYSEAGKILMGVSE